MNVRLKRHGFELEPETQFEADFLWQNYSHYADAVGHNKKVLACRLAKLGNSERVSLSLFDEKKVIEDNEKAVKTAKKAGKLRR